MSQATGQIAIYQTEDGQVQLEVALEQETVWLSQAQMVELFGRDQSVASRHIRNALSEGEVAEVCNMQKMHIANSDRPVAFYDLDVVISVGYRIKSERGVQFRRWATNVLRQHLVQGYALNQHRLEAQQEKLSELKQAIALSARLIHNKNLSHSELQGILSILEKYSHALTVLDDYDHQRLQVVGTRTLALPRITYDEAMQQIQLWRNLEKLGELFGNEKTVPSIARWRRSIRPSTAKNRIQASKERPRICFTSSSKTIRSPMVTSASPPQFLSGFWNATRSCTTPRERNASPIMRWLRSPCWLPRVSRTNGR